MEVSFLKDKIIQSAISPYDNYCVGYHGGKNYLTALILSFGTFKKTFNHKGSEILDNTIAFDKAEISEAYLGQINMTIVSSFCGPQGLIWGYDLVKNEDVSPFMFSSKIQKDLKEFGDIKIKNGENLKKAAKALFGTNKERHFPFLPGTHVPCAGRFYIRPGPTILYGTVAIGIPKNRERSACLLMEDVGEITGSKRVLKSMKEKLMINAAKAVLEVGQSQKINYQEIFIDFLAERVKVDEIGCILVAMPYFLLAKKALNKNLLNQDLEAWIKNSQANFLCNQRP